MLNRYRNELDVNSSFVQGAFDQQKNEIAGLPAQFQSLHASKTVSVLYQRDSETLSDTNDKLWKKGEKRKEEKENEQGK